LALSRRAESLDIAAADEPDAAPESVTHQGAAAEFSFAHQEIDHTDTYPQHGGGFAGPEFLAPMRKIYVS
jgi:hypothetical protein